MQYVVNIVQKKNKLRLLFFFIRSLLIFNFVQNSL